MNASQLYSDGPDVRYYWPLVGSFHTAASLARSWREGRISPDEYLELSGHRLTFRDACSGNPWLNKNVGPIPLPSGEESSSSKIDRYWCRYWCVIIAVVLPSLLLTATFVAGVSDLLLFPFPFLVRKSSNLSCYYSATRHRPAKSGF